MHAQMWRISRQTPVQDHTGAVLYRAPRDRVVSLLARPDVDPIGRGDKLKALRLRGPDPALSLEGSHRKRGVGSPHQHESYYNVRGVWHLDRIPVALQPHFNAVVLDCTRS
jgi:hypothetical protein